MAAGDFWAKPLAVRWPPANKAPVWGAVRQPTAPRPSRTSSCLEPHDLEEKKMLDAALRKVKSPSMVQRRIASPQSMKFLERAKKRLAVTDGMSVGCSEEIAMRTGGCRGRSRSGQDEGGSLSAGRSRRCECRGPTIEGQIGSIGVDHRPSTTRVFASSRKHPFKGGKTSSAVLCRRCVAINSKISVVGWTTKQAEMQIGHGFVNK